MPLGMAGAGEHLHLASGPCEDLAARNLHADTRNLVSLGLRADDGTAELLLQRRIAFDMIAVVVCGENVGQLPAALLQLLLDLDGVRRVDRGRCTAAVIMNQQTVIVRPADELVHFQMSHEASDLSTFRGEVFTAEDYVQS